MNFLYHLASTLLFPILWLLALVTNWRARDPDRWLSSRLGFVQRRHLPCRFWVHAASVGEVNAIMPLLGRLCANHPEQILVTTQTRTGLQRLRSHGPSGVSVVLAPFDAAFMIKQFLRRVQPEMLIITETELWPNMIRCSRQQSISVVLVNARISTRTFHRYQLCRHFFAPILQQFDWVLCQSDVDAKRFATLGVASTQLKVMGNLKYATTLANSVRRDAAHYRKHFQRPTFIAASTHEGEEAIVLEAFAKIRAFEPDCLLILVPRHPARVLQVLKLCHPWRTVRRSERALNDAPDILLVDTIGELTLWYGVADVAFVGGSLVPIGGHNPIEPGLWGLPILCGPYTVNFAEIVQDFTQRNGIITVSNADQIVGFVLDCLKGKYNLAASRGLQGFIASKAGVLDAYMDIISERLRS